MVSYGLLWSAAVPRFLRALRLSVLLRLRPAGLGLWTLGDILGPLLRLRSACSSFELLALLGLPSCERLMFLLMPLVELRGRDVTRRFLDLLLVHFL